MPTQIEDDPLIASGAAFTVTTTEVVPPVELNEINAVPALIPVTTPVEAPTVATPELELLQVPVLESVRVDVVPTHNVVAPEIPETAVKTVIVLLAAAVPQLLVTVYIMVSTPAATPVTTPVVAIVAFAFAALQVPPETPSLRVIVAPIATEEEPVMVPGLGNGLIPTTVVAVAAPQVPKTV